MESREQGHWRVVVIDLDEPLEDIVTGGASGIHVTALSRGRPVGTMTIATPIDPFPASLLAERLSYELGSWLFAHRLLATFADDDGGTAGHSKSVIVCTRDRPDALRRCLHSLQAVAGDVDEIIVVDNASPGNEVAHLVAEFGFGYVREPEPGLDRARNRGLTEASGELVLFTDDDVVVDPRWARQLGVAFADPLVMAATGYVLPELLDTPARRRAEQYAGHGRGPYPKLLDGTLAAPVRAGTAGAGASMAFRRWFLGSIGGFPDELDAGTATKSGGDTYALYRVLTAGYRIAYEPSALAFHRHRDSDADLRRMVRGYGTGTMSYLVHAAHVDRDPAAMHGLWAAARYFGGRAVKSLIRRSDAPPVSLVAEELLGAVETVKAYPAARRTSAARSKLQVGATPRPVSWLPSQTRVGAAIDVTISPTVSVVIPTRNRRDQVTRLVRALDDQAYPHARAEIVVVADGDVDGTVAALQSLSTRLPLRVVELEAPDHAPGHGNGAGHARNAGVRAARNDIALFLDDDVIPLDRRLLEHHATEHTRGADAVVGLCPVDLGPAPSFFAQRVRNWWVDQTMRLARTEHVAFSDVNTGNLSIRRELFFELGAFADLPRREDWELGQRLVSSGATVRIAPEAAVLQTIDVDLENALADRRREGAGDVGFARRHSELFGRLPLAQWLDLGRRRRLARLLIARPDLVRRLIDPGLVILERLEAAGQRERHVRLQNILSFASYWAGVGDAVADLDDWLDLVAHGIAGSTKRATVDIGSLWNQSFDWADAGTEVTAGSALLGYAPLRWGGVPWRKRAFADVVVTEYSEAALGAAAVELLEAR